ncbi:MAG: EAL domain-containing protein [Burkholderiaceae bacterium]
MPESPVDTSLKPVHLGIGFRLALVIGVISLLLHALAAYSFMRSGLIPLGGWQQIPNALIAILAMSAVGHTVAGFYLGNYVASRLRRVSVQLKNTQEGDYSTRVKVRGRDEIGVLAGQANRLTEKVESREKRIRSLSLRDPLTRLPNRAELTNRMKKALQVAKKNNSEFSVAVIDLDRFKWVNDTLGHAAGDKMLREVAQRLRATLPAQDTVARLGGDEFVLVLNGDLESAQAMAKQILGVMSDPMHLEKQTVDIGLSIGIAAFPQHGLDSLSLMRHADAAMYSAKRQQAGRSTYDGNDLEHDKVSSKYLSMLGEMRQALKNGEFYLEYQPKLNLDSGLIRGLEGLVRWDHPKRGFINPIEFVPIAEQTGFMRELTGWVVTDGIRFASKIAQSELSLRVSLNVSVHDIENPEFVGVLEAALSQHDADPTMICLEVTESGVLSETENALHNLNRIAKLGVKISVDDFGTGYASLQQLQRLPVDELKIDRSFVTGMIANRENATIVASTIEMGHQLGLNVVAEGVETVGEMRVLARMGCNDIQGFYLARAMPEAEVLSWISMRHALHDSSREDYFKALLAG